MGTRFSMSASLAWIALPETLLPTSARDSAAWVSQADVESVLATVGQPHLRPCPVTAMLVPAICTGCASAS